MLAVFKDLKEFVDKTVYMFNCGAFSGLLPKHPCHPVRFVA
jgi:hypothetical protein